MKMQANDQAKMEIIERLRVAPAQAAYAQAIKSRKGKKEAQKAFNLAFIDSFRDTDEGEGQ
jgi:hypothetical protein